MRNSGQEVLIYSADRLSSYQGIIDSFFCRFNSSCEQNIEVRNAISSRTFNQGTDTHLRPGENRYKVTRGKSNHYFAAHMGGRRNGARQAEGRPLSQARTLTWTERSISSQDDNTNMVSTCEHNGKTQQTPFINHRTSSYFPNTIQRENGSIDIFAQGIARVRPDCGHSCTPWHTVYITSYGSMPYTHTRHIGNRVQGTRGKITWRYAKVSYSRHGTFLLALFSYSILISEVRGCQDTQARFIGPFSHIPKISAFDLFNYMPARILTARTLIVGKK